MDTTTPVNLERGRSMESEPGEHPVENIKLTCLNFLNSTYFANFVCFFDTEDRLVNTPDIQQDLKNQFKQWAFAYSKALDEYAEFAQTIVSFQLSLRIIHSDEFDGDTSAIDNQLIENIHFECVKIMTDSNDSLIKRLYSSLLVWGEEEFGSQDIEDLKKRTETVARSMIGIASSVTTDTFKHMKSQTEKLSQHKNLLDNHTKTSFKETIDNAEL